MNLLSYLPKNKSRCKRFEAWLSNAPQSELDTAYARALKSRNAYQKLAIITELRKRELTSEVA